MKSSIKHFAKELDSLCQKNIPINKAFDILEISARSCLDLIVINVMRDSYFELLLEERVA